MSNPFYDKLILEAQQELHNNTSIDVLDNIGFEARPGSIIFSVTLLSVNVSMEHIVKTVEDALTHEVKNFSGGRYFVNTKVVSCKRVGVIQERVPKDEVEDYWDFYKPGLLIPTDRKFKNQYKLQFFIHRRIL